MIGDLISALVELEHDRERKSSEMEEEIRKNRRWDTYASAFSPARPGS
jgi:hypothetical protein